MAGPFKMKGYNYPGKSPMKEKNPKVEAGTEKRVTGDVYDDAYAAKDNDENMSYTDDYIKKVKKRVVKNKKITKKDRKQSEKDINRIRTYRNQQANVERGKTSTDSII